MIPANVLSLLMFNNRLALNSVLEITTEILTICPKVTKMESINGIGVLRGQRHIYPSKIDPSTHRVQMLRAGFSATYLGS